LLSPVDEKHADAVSTFLVSATAAVAAASCVAYRIDLSLAINEAEIKFPTLQFARRKLDRKIRLSPLIGAADDRLESTTGRVAILGQWWSHVSVALANGFPFNCNPHPSVLRKTRYR